jgi:hypothetical protein
MMNEEQEILKIEIPIEEETAMKPETVNGRGLNVKGGVAKIGQGVNQAGQAAWDSNARKTVTDSMKKGVQKGVTVVASKSADLMNEHMIKAAERQARQQAAQVETKIRETDWQAEAGKGAAVGLRWASERVGQLAARFAGNEKTPNEAQTLDD